MSLCDPMDCSCQAFLSMEFSGQEYWRGLPCPSPGDLPDPGIESGSPTLWADSLPSEPLLQRLPNAPTASLSASGTRKTTRSPGSHGPSDRAACTTAQTCGRAFSCSGSHQNSQLLDPWIVKNPWRRESYPLQYSDLENSMDWIVHGIAKSWTRLSDFHFHFLSDHSVNGPQ